MVLSSEECWRGMAAVVAMTSDALDLTESNATCRIYGKYGETSVFFRHMSVSFFPVGWFDAQRPYDDQTGE